MRGILALFPTKAPPLNEKGGESLLFKSAMPSANVSPAVLLPRNYRFVGSGYLPQVNFSPSGQ